MSKLSPAALTVWSAFLDHYEWEVTQTELHAVAAALRAAVDKAPAPDHHEEDAFHAGFWAAIEYVQSIATKLEAQ